MSETVKTLMATWTAVGGGQSHEMVETLLDTSYRRGLMIGAEREREEVQRKRNEELKTDPLVNPDYWYRGFGQRAQPKTKARIVAVGTVVDGIVSGWKFDCSNGALKYDTLIGGYTVEELREIAVAQDPHCSATARAMWDKACGYPTHRCEVAAAGGEQVPTTQSGETIVIHLSEPDIVMLDKMELALDRTEAVELLVLQALYRKEPEQPFSATQFVLDLARELGKSRLKDSPSKPSDTLRPGCFSILGIIFEHRDPMRDEYVINGLEIEKLKRLLEP